MDKDLVARLDREAAQLWEFHDPTQKPCWAWLAGIIDGEGCIDISLGQRKVKGHRTLLHQVRVVIQMTHKPTIQKVRQLTNVGSIRSVPRKPPQRNTWSWKATGARQVSAVLRLCLPWLVTKREEALIALAFAEMLRLSDDRFKTVTPQALAGRQALASAIRIVRKAESVGSQQGQRL